MSYLRKLASVDELVAAALEYAARGIRVIPLHSFGQKRCSCRKRACENAGKHPRFRAWQKKASTVLGWIRWCWKKWPRSNVGIVCGRGSGIVVLDVDPRNGGDASLAAMVAKYGPLPVTPTVMTGGGGAHYYFKHPDREVPWTDRYLGPGLEVKGDGKMVVAPLSLHKSGKRYEWIVPLSTPMAEVPPWMLPPVIQALECRNSNTKAMSGHIVIPPTMVMGEGGTAYGLKALAGEVMALTPGPHRNRRLYDAARRMGSLVAGGELEEEVVQEELLQAALAVGKPREESNSTINSGLEAGKRRPRFSSSRRRRTARPTPPAEKRDNNPVAGPLSPSFKVSPPSTSLGHGSAPRRPTLRPGDPHYPFEPIEDGQVMP